MNGGALKSKVLLPEEVGSDLPVTMWYFENSFGVVCNVPLRSSSHEELCLDCFPQRKYTDCGSHVYNKNTSADWFYEAFNNSPATESGMLQPGCLFVGIRHFDDSSNTDRFMKNSEHPCLQTILNLTLEIYQSSNSWMLVSLLPDLEVSDLKKSQSNHKSNADNLSLHHLTLYHKWMLWVFVFCIQRSWPVLWCLGAWFWLDACLLSSGYDHRWYRATQQAIYVASMEEMAYIGGKWVETVMWPVMMQTILILNVQEKMWRKLAGFLGGWWQHQSRMEMSCYAYRLTTKVSSPQKVDLNQPLMIGAVLFPRII